MLGDALQHLAEIGFWVEAVQLGRANQAVDRGSRCSIIGENPDLWKTKSRKEVSLSRR